MSAAKPMPSQHRLWHYGQVWQMTPRQFRRFKQKGAAIGDIVVQEYRYEGTRYKSVVVEETYYCQITKG